VFGLACLVLGVMVARLVMLMTAAHSEYGRAWLPPTAAGCAVSVGWAGLYAAAIWRCPGSRRADWIGYGYAFATIVVMAPFFPRSPGTGYSFTRRLPRGSSPPLLDWVMLAAMAFAAAGLTMAALVVVFIRPLSRLASSHPAAWGGANASSVLRVRARLREVGPAGPGRWRLGELRLAAGSVTWSMSRGRATVDLTGARPMTAGFRTAARVGRTRTVLVLAPAGRFEVGVRPELFQEFITLADRFRPWRGQGTETVDRGPAG
jgi:hypothetical protein